MERIKKKVKEEKQGKYTRYPYAQSVELEKSTPVDLIKGFVQILWGLQDGQTLDEV